MAEIKDIVVYCISLIFNVSILYSCCKKQRWQALGNIKYLIVSQTIFSSLAIASSIATFTGFSRESYYRCYPLPVLVVVFLSLALFNLTALVIVKHAQVTCDWQLRPRTTALIFLAVVSVSTALLSPVFFSFALGWPIIESNGCNGPPRNITVHVTAYKKISTSIDIKHYVFSFLVLQFIIPGVVVTNRLLLVAVYVWKKALHTGSSDTDGPAKSTTDVSIRAQGFVNTISIVAILLSIILLHHEADMSNGDKLDLTYFNEVFQKLGIFFLVILCFPLYLTEIAGFECGDDQTDTIWLMEKKEDQKEIDI